MSSKTPRFPNDPPPAPTVKRLALKPLRVAICVAGMLAATPPVALALELGEATLRSALGQTLVVQIPYRLAPNELLSAGCIGVVGPRAGDVLPAYSHVGRIAVTPSHIEIVGATRVLEPLLGLTVDVNCPSVPRFVRTYELFVDPPSRMPAIVADDVRLAAAAPAAEAGTPARTTAAEPPSAVSPSSAAASAPAARAIDTPRTSAPARTRAQNGAAVQQGETYLVVSGDTLSGIAARIVDRTVTIREAADAIFAANPDAFVRGNPDLLRAGRSLTIPVFTGRTVPPIVTEQAPPAREAAPAGATPPASETLASATPPQTVPDTVEPAASAIEPPAPAAEPAEPAAAVTNVTPSPTVAGSEPALPAPASTDAVPAVADPASPGRAWPWLTALLGLGGAVAVSVTLFGRRRKPAEPAPKSPAVRRAAPPRRLEDPLAGIDVVEGPPAAPPVQPASATPPHAPAAALAVAAVAATDETAALAIGVGLTDPVDLDVGSPATLDERVDWFAERKRTAATAAATPDEDTATIRTASPDAPTAVIERPRHSERSPADADEQTLTLVELDMLRQDWETEHTLTQASSEALRDAVADLEATQARRAASGDTVTLEVPEVESLETQPTQRLRKAR